MATKAEIALSNEAFFEQISDPGMQKQSADTINDFTRTKMREDGFARRIMEPLPITNADLDKNVSTDKPYKIVEKEVDNPPAISVPFATLGISHYIRGSKYLVEFDRILSPRFTKDKDELRTYVMDIRQVMSDNAIKDMLAEEDGKFITTVNAALVGQDSTVPASGVAQWQTINDSITRDSWEDSLKIMPKTPWHLEAHTALLNNVTIREFSKWGRDEMGGDFAQDVIKNGWSEAEFDKVRFIVTIKRDLVPDDRIYFFAHPKFIGKSYMLEDTTAFVKCERYFIEWDYWQTMGATIGHTGGLACASFE